MRTNESIFWEIVSDQASELASLDTLVGILLENFRNISTPDPNNPFCCENWWEDKRDELVTAFEVAQSRMQDITRVLERAASDYMEAEKSGARKS